MVGEEGDEARKIEQDVWKVEIPRKIFLIGKERSSRRQRQRFEKAPSGAVLL